MEDQPPVPLKPESEPPLVVPTDDTPPPQLSIPQPVPPTLQRNPSTHSRLSEEERVRIAQTRPKQSITQRLFPLALLASSLLLPQILPYHRSTKYCYSGVTTLSDDITSAATKPHCFRVAPDGTFLGVGDAIPGIPGFLDTTLNLFGLGGLGTTANVKSVGGERSDGRKAGRWVLPGLHDGHGHILMLGQALNSVDLVGSKSVEEVRGRIKSWVRGREYSEGTGAGGHWGSKERWIRGGGWDQNTFTGAEGVMPTAEELTNDLDLEGKYIMLSRIDVHCVWVSPAVLKLLPTPLPPSPPGGEIVTNPGPGVFCDNAMDMILAVAPKFSKEEKKTMIRDAMTELVKVGITAVTDASVLPDEADVYREIYNEDAIEREKGKKGSEAGAVVRVNAMLECYDRNTYCKDDAEKRKGKRDDGMFRLEGVKLFADGALGSWGAAMLEPYSDKLDTSGVMLINETSLTSVVKDWHANNWQIHIHGIGDRANRAAIDALASVYDPILSTSPGKIHRHRIEHAQIVYPEDQLRMANYAIIPSIQPTHATSDSPYALSRLGAERLQSSAYRMQTFTKLGLPLILGSDFPVERPSVLEGIWAAVTRTPASPTLNRPEYAEDEKEVKPFFPEEALTVKQALRGFTVAPAYGAFWEDKMGRVQRGMWADWVVVDGEIDEDSKAGELRGVQVVETWVAGRRVYCRDCESGKGKEETDSDSDSDSDSEGEEEEKKKENVDQPVGEGWVNDATEDRFDL
ncbi:hypothetical protein BJ508DRAFT_410130 [Ascobolus immersus RN42]|uniref:Amidohydrolase 3 domain-containing protein n=1 Tax=Ascobolus immersus RN42 TaxID=1160509 RepID=A0A3N4IU44_ASCIM|nr:hypothetical protein BJ508DRAFT_410130 [Ascobolus immersus RN42]